MTRFHAHKWNDYSKELTMLILTEDDIENETNSHLGAGYEILVLPSKYKDVKDNKHLNGIIHILEFRCGEIIYV